MRRRFCGVLFLSVVLTLTGCAKSGGDEVTDDATGPWPHSQMRLIVPFAEGGATSNSARASAAALEKQLGVKIQVEHIAGASGILGTQTFVESPDDGSVLFQATQLGLSASIVLQKPKFKIEDFTMLNFDQIVPIGISVSKSGPFKSMADLITAGKGGLNRPLNYAVVRGGHAEMIAKIMVDGLKLNAKAVYYDGAEGRNALMGGHVDFALGAASSVIGLEDRIMNVAVHAEDGHPYLKTFAPAVQLNAALKPYAAQVPLEVTSARGIAVRSTFAQKHPVLFKRLVDAWHAAFDSAEYKQYLVTAKEDVISKWLGAEESAKLLREMHAVTERIAPQLPKT